MDGTCAYVLFVAVTLSVLLSFYPYLLMSLDMITDVYVQVDSNTGQSMQALLSLDTVKCRMQTAADALQVTYCSDHVAN